MIQNLVKSGIRTLAGYAVAWLLSLKLAGPVLDAFNVGTETARERLTALLVFVLGTVYYLIVRALEERWPALGALLGVPSRPSYAPVVDGAHVVTTLPTAVRDASTGALLAVPVTDDAAKTLAAWDAIHPAPTEPEPAQ